MSNIKVVIIDYGLGNIFSIQRAIRKIGRDSIITDDHKKICEADRIILPGVGAFGDGMHELKRKKLDMLLKTCAEAGKPILGVCLGMQILMTNSEEFGEHKGLNLLPGEVVRFADPSLRGLQYKIPHVGWNQFFPPDKGLGGKEWQGTILSNNMPGDFAYFVHSYKVIPSVASDVLAVTEYGGSEFCSVVSRGNIFGCQFHPELSGNGGLKIYRAFIDMSWDG